MGKSYVMYHCHTEDSLLDSCTKFQDYVDLAVKNGQKALSISEHGKPLQWTEKWNACNQAGIKYMHSVEIYLTEQLEEKVRDNYHTVLIARNMDGVRELNALVSKSCDKDHFYYTNRITFEEFLNMSSNIISTSACLASFGTLQDKGVIDEVGRALAIRWDKSHNDGGNPFINALYDNRSGEKENPYTLKKLSKIKEEYVISPEKTKEKYPEIFYYFDGLVGTKVSQSVHPAGMVISPISLNDNYGTFDKDGDVCLKEYPQCKSALQWWCNVHEGNTTQWSIERSPYLKEFLIKNPPDFKISGMCCQHAKKNPIHRVISEGGYDLSCVGIRKSEGGIRSSTYKTCFSEKPYCGADVFRPIFWLRDPDKEAYCEFYGVTHSQCYTEYGLIRTGCIGCPFGKRFEEELNVLEQYEPKLYKAAIGVFGKSYEYTRKYLEFREEMKKNAT